MFFNSSSQEVIVPLVLAWGTGWQSSPPLPAACWSGPEYPHSLSLHGGTLSKFLWKNIIQTWSRTNISMFNSTSVISKITKERLSLVSFNNKILHKLYAYLNTFWHLFLSALLDLEIHRFSQNPSPSFHGKSLQGHLRFKCSKCKSHMYMYVQKMVIIFMLRYISNKWSDNFYLWATKHWNCQTSFKIP